MKNTEESSVVRLTSQFLTCIKSLFKSDSIISTQYADCVIKNQEGKILLLHRTYTDDFMNGKWGLPGGHIDDGEDALSAVIREVKEETGLDVQPFSIETREVNGSIIHYFGALVMTDTLDKQQIILDNEEHRGYEWSSTPGSYDCIADLASYIGELYQKVPNITRAECPQYTNIEEEIANIDQCWEILSKAFDEGKIDESTFLEARANYIAAKKKEAMEVIAKAFDNDLIPEEMYLHALTLVKGGDPSHGGKLVKKMITDKKGRMVAKWVDPHTGEEPVKEVKAKAPIQEHWWSKFKEYQLNCYPIGIDPDKVEVNDSGDVHSHWIMKWKDPKSGAIKNAYSKEFLARNAADKWKRIANVDAKTVSSIKDKSKGLYTGTEDEKIREAAAIINIIAHTGLRRGDKLKFEKSGNRGVSSLSPDSIDISGSTIRFNFIGKSYQENNAEIVDGDLAKFLTYCKEARKGQQFLFETTDAIIDSTFEKVGGKGLKIKDMRTYVATDLARKLLFEDKSAPPPIPEGLSVTAQKKLIGDKLKSVYQKVSQKLNNTPAMAKNSYIHPNILDTWIKKLDVGFEIAKSDSAASKEWPTLDELIAQYPVEKGGSINEDDEEMCDMFNEPEWLEELVD